MNGFGMLLLLAAFAPAAKLASLGVVDQDYIAVQVLDGEVTHKDDGLGTNAFTNANQADADSVKQYLPVLSTTLAQTATSWTIKSATDADFGTTGINPTTVYRKTKLNGHAQQAWSTALSDYVYQSTYEHTLYLKLPKSLKQGNTYTIEIAAGTNIDSTSKTLTFDIYSLPSEAIHTNLVGFDATSAIKAADLHIWLGDGAARDYSSFVGKKVYIHDVTSGTNTEVGSVTVGSATSAKDAYWRDLTKSPVWHVDFTGFSTPGTYRLVVDGVGASQDFKIANDVYFNPFMVSVQGFFYMREGQDSTGGIYPVPRRPLWIPGVNPANTVVYLTTMQPYHADWDNLGSGDKWDLKTEWAAYKKPGNPTNPNVRGGHADAADWDRHLGHVSIIYDMLLPYILSDGKLSDDNLDIAESGNGIPDIIDEARNEVDYWLSARDGAGYSHGINNPGSGNVFYQAGETGVAAWANAANASMLAYAFALAGKNDLCLRYADSAVVAWNYASALADPMLDNTQDVGVVTMRGRDFRMTAAAYLYNLTGDTKFEDAIMVDNEVKSATSVIMDNANYGQIWAVAGYLKTQRAIHYQSVWDNMKASVIYQAKTVEAGLSAKRASRRIVADVGSGYWLTAEFVPHTIVAHAVSTDEADKTYFKNALILEADYGLGRNAMNMIQMTTATTPLEKFRSVDGAYTTGRDDGAPGMHPGHTPYMNLDDWYCGMVMGCPSALYTNDYPADFKNTWPGDEAYHNTRYVWAHVEFTPQQTMGGKTALYGYLYSLGTDALPNSVKPQVKQNFTAGEYFIKVFDLSGRMIWNGTQQMNSLNDQLQWHPNQPGFYTVKIRDRAKVFSRSGWMM